MIILTRTIKALLLPILVCAVAIPLGLHGSAGQSTARAQNPVGDGAPALATPEPEAAPEAAPGNEIITGTSVFFGCAIGAAGGVVATALPPIAGWAMVAGALPGVAALFLTAGVGCSVGVVGGVIVSTVTWMADRVGKTWDETF